MYDSPLSVNRVFEKLGCGNVSELFARNYLVECKNLCKLTGLQVGGQCAFTVTPRLPAYYRSSTCLFKYKERVVG